MSDESDMEQSSSDMNVASWLSRATLDVSVSFLQSATTSVTGELIPDSRLGSEEVQKLVYEAK